MPRPLSFAIATIALFAMVGASPSVSYGQPPYDDEYEDEEVTTNIWDQVSEGIRRGTEQALPVMEAMRRQQEESARQQRELDRSNQEWAREQQEQRLMQQQQQLLAQQQQRALQNGSGSGSQLKPGNNYDGRGNLTYCSVRTDGTLQCGTN